MQEINVEEDAVVNLNIGGMRNMTVSRALLCSVPGSALEVMFSGRHELQKVDGRVFLDRNTEMFEHVLDSLRNKMQFPIIEDKFKAGLFNLELKYWGLPSPTFDSVNEEAQAE